MDAGTSGSLAGRVTDDFLQHQRSACTHAGHTFPPYNDDDDATRMKRRMMMRMMVMGVMVTRRKKRMLVIWTLPVFSLQYTDHDSSQFFTFL